MSTSFTVALTGQSLIQHDVRHVSDEGFAEVKKLIQQADVSFTNLETTILGRHEGWPMKGSAFTHAPAEVLDSLKEIGFNALALSNNHAFDLGPSGVLSTLEEVDGRGFLYAGIGVDDTSAHQAGVREFDARKVALVAMDAGPGPANMYAEDATDGRPSRPGVSRLDVSRVLEVNSKFFESLLAIQETFQSDPMERANYAQPNESPKLASSDEMDFYGTVFRRAPENQRRIIVDKASQDRQLGTIREAASNGAFVIAYLHHHHWEPSWREVPEWVRSFARSCVEAGANVFVSHGAPVLQSIEIYQGAPIFFGLGNFLFHLPEGEDEWASPDVWKSMVATCTFDGSNQVQSINLVPIVIGGEERLGNIGDYHERSVPSPATRQLADAMLEDLARRSESGITNVLKDARIFCAQTNCV